VPSHVWHILSQDLSKIWISEFKPEPKLTLPTAMTPIFDEPSPFLAWKLLIYVNLEVAEPRRKDLGIYRVDFLQTTCALHQPCRLELFSVVGLLVSHFPLVKRRLLYRGKNYHFGGRWIKKTIAHTGISKK
jgi:hypothetical protein